MNQSTEKILRHIKALSGCYLSYIYGYSITRNISQRHLIHSNDINKSSFDELHQSEIIFRGNLLVKLKFDGGVAFPGQVRVKNMYHQGYRAGSVERAYNS